MSAAGIPDQLEITHELLSALAGSVDDADCRAQHHPDLSPLGWHLGHCVYVECYWLHEQVRGDDTVTAPLARLYTPPHTPKPERGRLLPPQAELLAWANELYAFNRSYLANLPAGLADHPLFEDGYLQGFLLQHHSQHYETMLMVLTQRALAAAPEDFPVHTPLRPSQPVRESRQVRAGHYRIGGRRPEAFDNELPAQRAELGSFEIATRPISNAEYLAFMEAGGYQDARWWSAPGWAWREASGITHPDHWRRNRRGEWFG
ncbi:MAG: DinB family protein, partial [Gammaproteobacteria bacterium]